MGVVLTNGRGNDGLCYLLPLILFVLGGLSTRLLTSVLEGNVLICRGIRYLMDCRDLNRVPYSLMIAVLAPEILCRVMLLTILILDSAVSIRAVIVNDLPIIRDFLTRDLNEGGF